MANINFLFEDNISKLLGYKETKIKKYKKIKTNEELSNPDQKTRLNLSSDDFRQSRTKLGTEILLKSEETKKSKRTKATKNLGKCYQETKKYKNIFGLDNHDCNNRIESKRGRATEKKSFSGSRLSHRLIKISQEPRKKRNLLEKSEKIFKMKYRRSFFSKAPKQKSRLTSQEISSLLLKLQSKDFERIQKIFKNHEEYLENKSRKINRGSALVAFNRLRVPSKVARSLMENESKFSFLDFIILYLLSRAGISKQLSQKENEIMQQINFVL
eukprot:snap_masked-scaffold_4-processed-gene-10.37-mRNA-1 protein AED:1.00 eAED:1.00 QI:0/-1/0/0/-1/1/1/0/270